MSVRKDKVQIEVEINGKKATDTYDALKKTAKDLNRELAGLAPGTEAFIRKAAELKAVNDQLASIAKQTRGVANALDDIKPKGGGLFEAILGTAGGIGLVDVLENIGQRLKDFVVQSLELYNVGAKADAQLKAVLKSTDQIAGRNLAQLNAQADALQKITLFDDEATKGAQALLLTFTKVREDVFDETIPLIQDYATAMATATGESIDLKSATIQVGKALNDPLKGLTALGKAGVQFTDAQKELIRSMVESGRIADAQRVILAELETQFGGSAKAAAEAGLGGMTVFQNRIDNLKESVGELLAENLKELGPTIDTAIGAVEDFVEAEKKSEIATTGWGKALQFVYEGYKALLGVSDLAEGIGKRVRNFFTGEDDANARRDEQQALLKQLAEEEAAAKSKALADKLRAEEEAAVKKKENDAAAKIEADKAQKEREATKKKYEDFLKDFEDFKEKERIAGLSADERKLAEEAARYDKLIAQAVELEGKNVKAATEQRLTLESEKQAALEELRAQFAQRDLEAFANDLLAQNEAQLAADEAFLESRKKLDERLKEFTQEGMLSEREQALADLDTLHTELLAMAEAHGVDMTDIETSYRLQQKEINDKFDKEELDARTKSAAERAQLMADSFSAIGNVIGATLQLIGKDSKEFTALSKVLTLAKIAIDTASAISSLTAASAANPANAVTFGAAGFAQYATGIAQIIGNIAAAKEVLASAKFAGGGKVPISGRRITERGNIPTQSNGDNIVATVRTGEVVLNEQQQAKLGGDATFRAIGVPGFAGGGLTRVDTTPRGRFFRAYATGGLVAETVDGGRQTVDGGQQAGISNALLLEVLMELRKPKAAIIKREQILTVEEEDAFTAAKANL